MKSRLICLGVLILAAAMNAGAQTAPDRASDPVPKLSLESRAQATLSTVRGSLKVAGLEQPVSVLRDRWGVAHIYAQNQHDLFFAQGFVAAQDRLFQMELWKRSGQGRLAEVLGPSALPRDINARLLSYRGDMKAEYESYAPDTQQILEAFTAGINAYIERRLLPGGPGLPLGFQLAGFKPEPWKPEDCLNRMAAFSMTGNAFDELDHAQAVNAVGADAASLLFDFDPPVKLEVAPGTDLSGFSSALLHNLVGSDTRIEFPRHPPEGSNNWTVSGKLTRTGKPLLANDPHRVIAEPSLRYMVHLVAPGWDVIGAGEPGLPGVALGHNRNIAWGFTIFGLDQQDLYVEDLNPSDSSQYKTAEGWAQMQVRKETFGVRGGPSVQVNLKFTRHGPVLWEDGKRALALRWVGAEPGTAGYLGSLAVDRAQNWQEFEAAMARWKVPSENIVYADRAGNIGEHSTGLAPLRKTWTGLLPVPGSGGYEWSGFVPNAELPHQYNPPAGFVATANHKMIPEGYPYKVGYSWEPPYRFHRITQVLQQARAGKKLDVEGMQRLQCDVLSLPALQFDRTAARSHGTPEVHPCVASSAAVERRSRARLGGRRTVRSLAADCNPRDGQPGGATRRTDDDGRLVSSSSAELPRRQRSPTHGRAGRDSERHAAKVPGGSLERDGEAPGSRSRPIGRGDRYTTPGFVILSIKCPAWLRSPIRNRSRVRAMTTPSTPRDIPSVHSTRFQARAIAKFSISAIGTTRLR